MSDAWWLRDPTPTLAPDEPPPVVTTDAAVPPAAPNPVPADTGPTVLRPTVLRATRRRARQLRRPGVLLASGAGVLALVLAGLGGMALAERRAPAREPVPARAVPLDNSLVTASATSVQQADGGTTYVAANTLDGDPTTAWNSNGARDGKGPGISLTYTFTRPVDLRDISLRNGYQRIRQRAGRSPVDLYSVNARVRRLRVVTDAGAWIWDLVDTRTPQTFAGAAGRTGSVRLEILAVYPSRTYPDVAISEIGFTSTP